MPSFSPLSVLFVEVHYAIEEVIVCFGLVAELSQAVTCCLLDLQARDVAQISSKDTRYLAIKRRRCLKLLTHQVAAPPFVGSVSFHVTWRFSHLGSSAGHVPSRVYRPELGWAFTAGGLPG